jgi:nucleoside diphosphate kinase
MAVKAEISYVMVKPDGVQRGLVGDIISRWVGSDLDLHHAALN